MEEDDRMKVYKLIKEPVGGAVKDGLCYLLQFGFLKEIEIDEAVRDYFVEIWRLDDIQKHLFEGLKKFSEYLEELK